MSDEYNEAELIARLRANDESAFDLVVRKYGPRILAVTRRFLQNEEDAREAVQDAFLSAFKAVDSFHGNSLFSTWLHRIAVNAALLKLRSRRGKSESSIDDLLPKFADDGRLAGEIGSWAVRYDTAIHDREVRELVQRKIDELPDTYRAVLLLRDIEGKSTEETAELIGATSGAVNITFSISVCASEKSASRDNRLKASTTT